VETPALWEQILLGILAILVLLWFRPGIKAAFRERRQASQSEWLDALLPIGLVALFVILLIALS
jgi:hypothetical protein